MSDSPAFTVLIPARLASTRLPNKPLADIAGLPMVVRVARQACVSGARRCVVAADDASIVSACEAHGVPALLTRPDHPSGSDRLAQACELLGLGDDEIVGVNIPTGIPLYYELNDDFTPVVAGGRYLDPAAAAASIAAVASQGKK